MIVNIAEIEKNINYLLKHNLGKSHLSYSPYDTAWIAKIPSHNSNIPMFPQCIAWLLDHQNFDNSWGNESNYIYLYDKLLSTLEVIITLKEWEDKGYGHYEDKIQNGLEFINKNINKLDTKSYRSVGFETIFPIEFKKAKNIGIHIKQTKYLRDLILLRQKKLQYIDIILILNNKTTLLYSLEGLDDQPLDWNKILSLQDSNGAFLCSPSSTAYAYLKTKDQKCLKYLISLLDGKNAVSVNTPIEVFEINWCLEIISKLNLNHIFSEEYNKHLSYIFKSWNIEGMSWSTQFNLADLDDTSVSYYLLKQAGHIKVNANIFNRFVENNKIFCFKGELDASPSHILHLIQALQDNQSSDILRLHAIKTILDLTHNNNWKDKWHLSPYYLLHLLIENIGNDNPYYMDIYYKFIRKSQNLDGGWGNKNSNKEETAWACYSLLRIKNFEKLQNFENILKKGIEYLINNKLVKEDNNLWIAKFLFTPYTIIEILKDCVVLSYALRNN